MERGKRASMREGPLAALFRKTEEDGVEPAAGSPQPAEEKSARGERAEFGQTPEPRGGTPYPSPDHSQSRLEDSDPRL